MHLLALQPDFEINNYQIQELIGEGGFGLTYLAIDTQSDEFVAIKEYLPSECAIRQEDGSIIPKSDSAKQVFDLGLQAFVNEANTLSHFEHPSIVKVFNYFIGNGTAYIVMEYCDAGSLAEKLNEKNFIKKNNIESILAPIIKGLQKVHEKGILHLDIKPENIMFRSDGTPVLIDFGAARLRISQKTRHVKAIYTPGFAPLEQFSTDSRIGPGTDIYALAAVAYNYITGKKPPSATQRIVNDKIDKISNYGDSNFHTSIDKALSLHIDDRPPTLRNWLVTWNKGYKQNQGASIVTELNLEE